ncbi:Ldh family oxidoreductase [Pollutimonas bauzanensis]|uniref:(2R)-3-sulfolactate dehydrogenase (NADP+) n=1 Tax=Pollutimonas bauzanensis TaxID=658167 RepID=A0A1M5M0H3_9BURK|nr:Ldh family oxidoreductase [Pollutimonas bauzanensis]SHG70755.1 (2R)-3-sulfolactate dehydrogenase (NADP+) [Pollutimonas bauzanensis]
MRENSEPVLLMPEDVRNLAVRALRACGVLESNAASVAESIEAAEADGMHSHGLMRLPAYCRHVLCGKVDGSAVPCLRYPMPGALLVDAAHGFAHPAIDLGLPSLSAAAKKQGIAMMAVTRSYNAGAMGYHVERLARSGVLGLAFANAPASIAAWGGIRPLFGTNPIAFSAPGPRGPALVIDQACSIVARGEVLRKALAGEALPEGWALDADGRAARDPQAALAGTMLPIAGPKGVNLAWIAEVLASSLTGAQPSYEASSIIDDEGGPPGIGQLFIAMAPDGFLPGFGQRVDQICDRIKREPGARVPGAGRWRARAGSRESGIAISRGLYEEIQAYC